MSRRKKKNVVTLILLFVALAALVGIYVWYAGRVKEKKEEEESPAIELATIDTDLISSMHYINDDADIVLIKQDDVWVSEDEPGRPIKQTNVTSMLNAIKSIKAERIVSENSDKLDEFGLDDPAILEVTLEDGKKVTIKIGIEVIHSMGYYGMVNDDKNVYMLTRDIGLAMRYNNTDMTEVEKTPSADLANIRYIRITNKNGSEYELGKYTEKIYSNAGNALNTWKILKPYGLKYGADEAKMQELLPVYASFSFLSCVDYKAEDLSKYGLDDPTATIHVGYYISRTEKLDKPEKDPETDKLITEKTYNDPAEYMLYIGNKDEDGNYYARLEGSQAVHTIDDVKVDTMLNVDAFNLLDKYVLMPNIVDVDRIQAEVNGKTYDMEIKRTTEKDDEGKEKTISTYFFNGKESEEKAFKTNYQAMISAQYDSVIKDEISLDGVKPVLSLSMHLFGEGEGTYSVKFYPYNDYFNIIQNADGMVFFADKRRIDTIIESITNFTGKTNQ